MAAVGQAAAALLGLETARSVGSILTTFGPLTLICACLDATGRILYHAVRVAMTSPRLSPREGWRRTWRRLQPDFLERVLPLPILMVTLAVLFDSVAVFRPAIPRFTSYHWDPLFASVDSFLHLGDPWAILHALPHLVLECLDRLYVVWFEVKILWLIATLFVGSMLLRVRTLYALVLLWSLAGIVAATIFASGGPVYYGEFTGDHSRFASLLNGLEGTRASAIQHHLWEAFQGRADLVFGGITAFPSMHVAVVCLIAIWSYQVHRVLGWVTTVYAVLIFLGSVALGWHYAIDGYAGAAAAFGCWWLAGRAVGEEPARPAAETEPD